MTRILTLVSFFGLLLHAGLGRAGDEWEKAFACPPPEAHAWCYWWWLNGAASKEGIDFEQLDDWAKRPEEGIRHYSGTATYRRTFDLPETARSPSPRTFLDLGRVQNLARIRLNGNDLGIVWTAPWRVEITDAVKATGNRLEIDVVNLWPNRLIGDAALPPEQRLTKTNVTTYKKDSPLLESGLLGPVTLNIDSAR